MAMKKIKSVKKNGIEFKWSNIGKVWLSTEANEYGYNEFIQEEVILACPLFEIKYEEDEEHKQLAEAQAYLTRSAEMLKEIQQMISDICKTKNPASN